MHAHALRCHLSPCTCTSRKVLLVSRKGKGKGKGQIGISYRHHSAHSYAVRKGKLLVSGWTRKWFLKDRFCRIPLQAKALAGCAQVCRLTKGHGSMVHPASGHELPAPLFVQSSCVLILCDGHSHKTNLKGAACIIYRSHSMPAHRTQHVP